MNAQLDHISSKQRNQQRTYLRKCPCQLVEQSRLAHRRKPCAVQASILNHSLAASQWRRASLLSMTMRTIHRCTGTARSIDVGTTTSKAGACNEVCFNPRGCQSPASCLAVCFNLLTPDCAQTWGGPSCSRLLAANVQVMTIVPLLSMQHRNCNNACN